MKQGSTTLRAFTYAANGAVTQDVRGASTYGYGQRYAATLSSVSLNGSSQAVYISDAFRRLRVRTLNAGAAPGTTHYVWDIFGHVIAEHVVGTGLAREYVWLGDMPLAAVDATAAPAKLYFVHVDHLDRPALMTDSARRTVWKASYEPFGAVRSIVGSASLDLRFPGQWFQLESGLAYNWNCHYDPTLGRYVQPDPMGFVDGPSLYGYTGQSPLTNVDPTGNQTVNLLGTIIGSDLAVPDPTDVLPLKWGVYAAATCAAVGIDWLIWQTRKSGKEKASDIPSWAKGEKPNEGESGKDFADRIQDRKYGRGNYPKGPSTEHSKIREFGDRR